MKRPSWIDELQPVQEDSDGQEFTRVYHRPYKGRIQVWLVKLTDDGEFISAQNITPKPCKSETLVDENKRMRKALEEIKKATDADDESSYRVDDPEGCLDHVFATASTALRD